MRWLGGKIAKKATPKYPPGTQPKSTGSGQNGAHFGHYLSAIAHTPAKAWSKLNRGWEGGWVSPLTGELSFADRRAEQAFSQPKPPYVAPENNRGTTPGDPGLAGRVRWLTCRIASRWRRFQP